MKVAFVSGSSPLEDGGASESTMLISEGLRDMGISVDVFSTTGDCRKKVRVREGVYEIPSAECYPFAKRVATNVSVFKHLPDLTEYDIVHGYGTSFLPALTLRSKMTGNGSLVIGTANTLSWVCTNWTRYLEQGCPSYGFKKMVEYSFAEGYRILLPAKAGLEVMGKSLSKHSDCFTAQTDGIKNIMADCGYNRDKIEVVPNLLDDRFDISSENPDKTVIFVGRLIERKGVRDVFDAFVEVEPDLPENWKLKIFGDGPLKPELKQLSEETDNVSVGYCPYDKLPEVYQDASVLVHGTKYPEPFSRTWLEAMASETAIVASRNPSSEAVLSDCAELYDPFDEESLRESLRSVLSNKEKRDRLRKKGKVEIENYRAEKIVNKYVDIYDSLVERGV